MDDRGKNTEWKPGESGNPKGRPRTKPLTDMLKKLLDKDDGAAMAKIIKTAIEAAQSGDVRYFKEIMDRVEGKVIEPIDLNANMNVQEMKGATAADLAALAGVHDGPKD